MNVTNDMAEAALDALDDACIGFQRSCNPSASVHWKGFTRDDRVAAMRTALSAALSKQDAAIALMRGQSAAGKVNGYLFREKAIEILMDSEIPMWMTRTPGIRVTVSPAEGHSR